MADVKINLEAAHKEFLDSLKQASQAAQKLITTMKDAEKGHKDLSATAAASARDAAAEELKAARLIVAAKSLILREAKALAAQQKQIQLGVTQAAKEAAAAQVAAQASITGQGKGIYEQMSQAAKGHFAATKAEQQAQRAAQQATATQAKGTYDQMTQAAKGHFAAVKSEHHAQVIQAKGTYEQMSNAARAHFAQVSSDAKRSAKDRSDALKEQHRLQLQQQRDIAAESNTTGGAFASLRLGAVAAFAAIYAAVTLVIGGVRQLSNIVQSTITNIDDFRKQTIGTAAAITNIRDEAENAGKTWDQTFHQNLKATIGTFLELERLSARYFASAQDLQLAYNAFAQRGIIVRREELKQLAQTTDLILLLTQGQQTTIQVQEEIRSLINGTLRPTAQLGQLLKSYGKDIKEVANNIRIFQSLRPLDDVLRGAALATNEIQKTFQATMNGLEVIFKQIQRVGGEQFFNRIVGAVQKFTDFLTKNRGTLAGYFGVAGEIVSETLVRFEKFLETLLKGNDAARDGSPVFITLATSIQVVGIAMARLLELIVLLIRDLPLAIAAFRDVFDEQTADKAVSNIDKVKDSLLKLVRGSPLGILFEQFLKLSKIEINLPGQKGLEAFLKGLQEFSKLLQADVKAVGGFDLAPLFKELNAKNNAAFKDSKARADKLLTQGQGDLPAPTSRGFQPSPEDLATLKHSRNELLAATIQADRAARQAAQALTSSQVDIDLQALRRDLALLEEGFIASRGVISGFRSVVNDLNTLIKRDLQSVVQGTTVDFTELTASIAKTSSAIQVSKIENLQDQLLTARGGLETYVTAVKAKNAEIIEDTTAPLLEAARLIRQEVGALFDAVVKQGKDMVEKAKDNLHKAIQSGDSAAVRVATNELSNVEALARIGVREGTKQRDFGLKAAEVKEATAEMLTQKTLSQEATQIAVEENRILSEVLRIRQQINLEIGKSLKSQTALNTQILEFEKKVEESRPRTPLQAAQAGITEEQINLQKSVGLLQGELQSLNVALSLTWYEGGRATEELKEQIKALRLIIPERQKEIDKLIETARVLTALEAATQAVSNAVQNTAGLLIQGLTDAFEGKKTDFIRGFKNIADSLFKDSLKNVIESAKVGMSKAFQSLAQAIPGGMGKVLGPAFLAGFALIASFVLGQLLSGDNSSGSPGNPSVGIQSSEQVRGLIGGATQIPIGLVGESLQSALVPTNLLLSRIAAGVDRLSFGGIDPSIIESTISASISDALQIQLSAT